MNTEKQKLNKPKMTKYEWINLSYHDKLTKEHINLWLLEGNFINEQDFRGRTALMFACKYGNYAVAKLLIDKGADYMLKNKDGKTALDYTKNNVIIRYLKSIINQHIINIPDNINTIIIKSNNPNLKIIQN